MSTIRQLYNKMLHYGEISGDKTFTPASLTRVIRSMMGTDDIKMVTRRSSKVDLNQVVIGGLYDPDEDAENFASITLYINFNPDQGEFHLRDIDWQSVCVGLIECAGHELIHQEQYRRRDYDLPPSIFVSRKKDLELRQEQEYLGNPDEIEAYGYSIAAEIFLNQNPRRLNGRHIHSSLLFKSYSKAFGVQHPVVKKLIGYAVLYYGQLKGDSNVKKSKQHSR